MTRQNRVIDRDIGFETVPRTLKAAKGRELFVGFFEPEVAEYATVHEFGNAENNETAFMRKAVDANLDPIFKAFADGLGGAFDEVQREQIDAARSANLAYRQAGLLIIDVVVASINREGLVDTGRMRSSVRGKIISTTGGGTLRRVDK